MQTENLFYQLIRIAIGTQACLSLQPSAKDWAVLYDMAQKQSLVGVCFAGVQRICNSDAGDYCGMNKLQYFTWMGMAAMIQQRNQVQKEQCVKLVERLKSKGYRSCILKGQGTALLYGDLSTLRQSGDIDVWVMPEDVRTIRESRTRIDELVHGMFPDEKGAFVHIGFPVFSDTEVEMHYVPTMDGCPWVNRRLTRMFEQRQDACFGNVTELGFAVPESEVNVVFNLHHVMKHFIGEGIGLRHLMDLYFVLRTVQKVHPSTGSGTMVQEVQLLTKKLGMKRFASGVMWLLKDCFGASEDILLCEPNERLGRVLLTEIMRGGNFGHHDGRLEGLGHMSFWKRWRSIMNVSLVRFRYFPVATFWAWVFRVRVGMWKRFSN